MGIIVDWLFGVGCGMAILSVVVFVTNPTACSMVQQDAIRADQERIIRGIYSDPLVECPTKVNCVENDKLLPTPLDPWQEGHWECDKWSNISKTYGVGATFEVHENTYFTPDCNKSVGDLMTCTFWENKSESCEVITKGCYVIVYNPVCTHYIWAK